MNRVLALLSWITLFPAAALAQSDVLKELAQIAAGRVKAYEQGDANAWAATYAENAVFHAGESPFRMEGRNAIRAYFAEHFAQYPGARRYAVRQPSARVYGEASS